MYRKLLIPIAAFLVMGWFVTAAFAGDTTKVKAVPNDTAQSDNSLSKPVAQESAPVIFFPETGHDFGSVGQNTTLTHIFKVKNVGDALLKIGSVKAS
jgi:archaellum component FlaG (FlaF/FlaG flagellin family)